jgi:hypothetical protein
VEVERSPSKSTPDETLVDIVYIRRAKLAMYVQRARRAVQTAREHNKLNRSLSTKVYFCSNFRRRLRRVDRSIVRLRLTG